ncbi:MAG: hypothetical protein Q7W13_13120 [Bacteroidia bacterium]|nr:hypothetical protein [Bacteroidia bacterium]
MTTENKLFKPNFDKPLFTITIQVFENCAKVGVAPENGREVGYHEVIGALEAQKNHFIFCQREANIKAGKLLKKTKPRPTGK